MSELELIPNAIRGDRDALAELLNRYGDIVAAHLRGDINPQWRSVLDIDDVMQVTFVEAFLQISRFGGSDGSSFVSWLRRIAKNNLRDAIRALKCEKRPQPGNRVHSPAGQDSCVTLIEQIAGSTITISGKAGIREMTALLNEALRKLPSDYEIVLRLYDLEGLTGPEVADRMGRRRGAIHMLRARALVRLGELVGAESNFFTHGA